ncbi:MAG: tRNA epoxyqueuosine(34) reductase QueG [Gemmatimonadaceae bacterium]
MIAREPPALELLIEAQAYGLGFDLSGIARLGPAETAAALDDWLANGYDGEMGYMSRWTDKRRDTRLPFPGARTAVVVAMNYGGTEPSGPIARYARGDDYHDVMLDRLRELHAWIEKEAGREIRGKAYVDTGPILERDLARRAGLGWFGKNTNLIHPRLGSFFFLGALLLDIDMEPSAPFEADRCGSCTRCIDACPTEAIREPRVLDATRCISYLTIELRGAIPEELREPMGELVYGCDICQDVCPWNHRFSRPLAEPAFKARRPFEAPSLVDWITMSPEDWRTFSRASPAKRTRRRGFLRNVAVALGNRGDPGAVPALVAALSDEEPLVRGHAAWALGRIGSIAALEPLRARTAAEADGWALEEMRSAIANLVR